MNTEVHSACVCVTQWGTCVSIYNKKVLLRERKRHTARRVVSTPSVVLPGYPPPGGGGVPGPRYPPRGVPISHNALQHFPECHEAAGGGGGTRTSVPPPPRGGGGYPDLGTPPPPPGGGGGGVPGPRYPPPPPRLPHGILGNVAKHYGIWVPPPPCGQTDWWMDRRMSKHYLPSYYVRGR